MTFPILRSTLVLWFTAFFGTAAVHAQSVAMTGVMGSKALLVINGGAPKALGTDQSHQGVRLIAVHGEQATIEYQGQRQTVRMGASPISIGQLAPAGQRKVVLRADNQGHFRGNGFINDKAMHYMVDTGASVIGIGITDAQRLRLDYSQGERVTLRTANGNAQGWRIKLDSVRVGDITLYGIHAVVSPQPMPHILLGNSFLSQLHMTRQGNEMVLERR